MKNKVIPPLLNNMMDTNKGNMIHSSPAHPYLHLRAKRCCKTQPPPEIRSLKPIREAIQRAAKV
jgi:hypothetical protein